MGGGSVTYAPRIAVVMNVLNEADWIYEAITQTEHPDVEWVLVSDSGSDSDAGLRLAKVAIEGRCGEWFKASSRQPHLAQRRNEVLRLAKAHGATHAIVVDPDERYEPGAFDALVQAIKTTPEAHLFGARYYDVQPDGSCDTSGDGPWVHRAIHLAAHPPIQCADGGLGWYSGAIHEEPVEWARAAGDRPPCNVLGAKIRHYSAYKRAKAEVASKHGRYTEQMRRRMADPNDTEAAGWAALWAQAQATEGLNKAVELMNEAVATLTRPGRKASLGCALRVIHSRVVLDLLQGKIEQASASFDSLKRLLVGLEAHPDLLYTEALLHAARGEATRDEVEWEIAQRLSEEAVASGQTMVTKGCKPFGARPW